MQQTPGGLTNHERGREPSPQQQFTASTRGQIKTAQQRYFGQSMKGNRAVAASEDGRLPFSEPAESGRLGAQPLTADPPKVLSPPHAPRNPSDPQKAACPRGLDPRPQPAQGLRGPGVTENREWYNQVCKSEPKPQSRKVPAATKADGLEGAHPTRVREGAPSQPSITETCLRKAQNDSAVGSTMSPGRTCSGPNSQNATLLGLLG